MNYTNLEQQTI